MGLLRLHVAVPTNSTLTVDEAALQHTPQHFAGSALAPGRAALHARTALPHHFCTLSRKAALCVGTAVLCWFITLSRQGVPVCVVQWVHASALCHIRCINLQGKGPRCQGCGTLLIRLGVAPGRVAGDMPKWSCRSATEPGENSCLLSKCRGNVNNGAHQFLQS